ncbi:MAG TPA: enolase C-terminal domain-like protein, partial [Bryobacteraceae bacterium]|nr:enolase C-terminal domain-like protein [Bryobacteraceae bacterium]
MKPKRRKLTTFGTAFAPPAAEDHPLRIVDFHAWRLKEPDSGRRYSVVRLRAQGGATGYGEGGPSLAAEIAAARTAVMNRRATESEYVRASLAGLPALEAAVSNAMLDLASRAKEMPIYRYLGGPVRYKARLLAHLEGKTAAEARPSLERAKRQGFQLFTTAAPVRDAMIPLRAYVDQVRQHLTDMQALAGAGAEWVLDGHGAMTPGDAATLAVALEPLHPVWFDEPTGVITQDALAKIVDESVMPIGLGRAITGLD